jgi:hypothetical protein
MRREARKRRLRRTGGTPIEEAPHWALAIFALLLWLIAFPAIVGLLAGLDAWHGRHLPAALASLALAVLVTAGAATRRPWRRAPPTALHDPRPLFVRFSTWLIVALLLPNVLFGTLVLTQPRPEIGYRGAALVAMLVSAVHGAAVAFARRGRPPAP